MAKAVETVIATLAAANHKPVATALEDFFIFTVSDNSIWSDRC